MPTIAAFPVVISAVRALLIAEFAQINGRVGGSASYAVGQDPYIRIEQSPGGGTSVNEGEWAIDIAVWDDSLTNAQRIANELEAFLLGRRGAKYGGMILDRVSSNQVPGPRPTSDPKVFEIGSIYVFEARRKA